MSRYKILYEDRYGEIHKTEVNASSEQEATNKFNNHSNDILINVELL